MTRNQLRVLVSINLFINPTAITIARYTRIPLNCVKQIISQLIKAELAYKLTMPPPDPGIFRITLKGRQQSWNLGPR